MEKRTDRTPLVPWGVGDAALVTGLVIVSVLALLALSLLLASPTDVDEETALNPWILGIAEGLMVGFVWIFSVKKYRVGWHLLGLRRTTGWTSYLLPFAALAGTIAFTAVYVLIVEGLGLEFLEPPPVPDDALGEGLTLTLNRLIIVVWGPFAEEVFFRGFLLAAFIAPFGRRNAIIISSAIFALAHVDPGTMMPIFVTGALLSWVYLRTRSLWPSVAAHALQNFLALAVATS